jgi:hypothetical protein
MDAHKAQSSTRRDRARQYCDLSPNRPEEPPSRPLWLSGEAREVWDRCRSRLVRFAALDQLPPRLPQVPLFASPQGGLLNIDKFRRREWAPAIEASDVTRPATI